MDYERRNTRVVGYGALAVLAVGIGVGAIRAATRDVRVARQTLTRLAAGDATVARSVAWDRLRAMGVDVGGTYAGLPSDWERRQYEQAFVQQFAQGFAKMSGSMDRLSTWRVVSNTKEIVTVAADVRGEGTGESAPRTLMMAFATAGGRKLVRMGWQ